MAVLICATLPMPLILVTFIDLHQISKYNCTKIEVIKVPEVLSGGRCYCPSDLTWQCFGSCSALIRARPGPEQCQVKPDGKAGRMPLFWLPERFRPWWINSLLDGESFLVGFRAGFEPSTFAPRSRPLNHGHDHGPCFFGIVMTRKINCCSYMFQVETGHCLQHVFLVWFRLILYFLIT